MVTYADVAQLVEHNLAKVGVAGSNPVIRSIEFDEQENLLLVSFCLLNCLRAQGCNDKHEILERTY